MMLSAFALSILLATLTKWQEAIFQDGLSTSNLVFPAKIECISEICVLYFQPVMHPSGLTV